MISGVVLARNEEFNIVDCLNSLRPYVSELVLIDMESTDTTVSKAAPLVDRVLSHPLIPNFDVARNIAIDEVSNPWLWYLDADERVSEQVGQAVSRLVEQVAGDIDAITIPFKSYFCGKWIQHCGWWPGYTMPRVLRRGRFRFSERLHGGVIFSGRELRLPANPELGIEHFSYRDLEHYLEKFNRYTSVESQQLSDGGQLLNWEVAFRHMVHDWWKYYEGHVGYKEGQHGWILAWLAGQYRWFSHAKLLDRQERQLDYHVVPSLDAIVGVIESEIARQRARTPTLPMGIVWRSPIWDPSGYAEDSRIHIQSLAAGVRELQIRDIRWSDAKCPIPQSNVALFNALGRAERPKCAIAITSCIASLVSPDPDAVVNILRTTFETDRIPEDWLPVIDQFDEVWVFSRQNFQSFQQGGVAKEKLRVLGGFVDTSVFCPEGPSRQRPASLERRFLFLSLFDWQLRKGWDVLVKAYVSEFSQSDDMGLLLKVTRAHGHDLDCIRAELDAALHSAGQSLESRQDIVLIEDFMDSQELAALYRSADAFVLSSRGEGWGRPYMEAMASGLPTIGMMGSGNDDFMNSGNSLQVDGQWVPVPREAAKEIPVYRGHNWLEPDLDDLRRKLRLMQQDGPLRDQLSAQAVADMQSGFDIQLARDAVEANLVEIEKRFVQSPMPPATLDAIGVEWEGELCANHSFSNINEQLLLRLSKSDDLSLSILRKVHNPTHDRQSPYYHELSPFINRSLKGEPEITVRHAFPPNWESPSSGKWVHIQPWEFGALPVDWIEPLRDRVDEIWVPTTFVKQIYERSGIASEKIFVIPWGVDSNIYNPATLPRLLPTDKTFRFLFVGGSIGRKGIDWLLNAYMQEFSQEDDVCLVIKDLGVSTFYRYGNYRDRILQLLGQEHVPEIVYLDQDMTDCQRAGLYAACQALVAPYRGEGFGLPILEAMACGVCPIVPSGGASDDFVAEETGYLLAAEEVECVHDWRLRGVPTELSIEVDELRRAMRRAYENREKTAKRGRRGSVAVAQHSTWSHTVDLMLQRIEALAKSSETPMRTHQRSTEIPTLSLCIAFQNDEDCLSDCMGRLRPFVNEIVGVDVGSSDRSKVVASEYGARVYQDESIQHSGRARNLALVRATSDWVLSLDPWDQLSDPPARNIASMLAELPKDVLGVNLRYHETGYFEYKTRIVRNLNDLVFDFRAGESPAESINRLGGRIVDFDIDVHVCPDASIDYDERLQLAHMDLGERPGHSWPLLTLGRTHYQLGNFFHAECYLDDFLTKTSTGSFARDVAFLLITLCHERKGDVHRAEETATAGLDEFPLDSQLMETRQRILRVLRSNV